MEQFVMRQMTAVSGALGSLRASPHSMALAQASEAQRVPPYQIPSL
jgi:hypothetical protein